MNVSPFRAENHRGENARDLRRDGIAIEFARVKGGVKR
jgi:hypothetical protein